MFHTSSQKSNWLFSGANELAELRKKANHDYIKSQNVDRNFLTYDEERIIQTHYEYTLKNFCGKFRPAITMPSVIGTSIMYFKRLYLRNSVMDLHPKELYLVCVYLACKIEEFNVSISEFVQNIPCNSMEERDEYANMILNFELLLIEKLDFHLTIHNFYRPFEGFLLDVKTRCPEIAQSVDVLRSFGMEFLDKILNSDAILLFPPSQIALTAIVFSASKNRIDLDKYCRSVLLSNLSLEQVKQILSIVKTINKMHKDIPALNLEEIKRIEAKLNLCYDSEKYKRMAESNQKLLENDDD